MNRFDEMFTTGLETMVANSSAIVAGPVLHYSKNIKEHSEGSDPIPAKWVISGQLERPETLKGDEQIDSLQLTRNEQTPFLPTPVPVPAWESEYSHWQPGDKAVAFLGKKPDEILLVVPSGTGDRDLITLVRLIVSNNAMDSTEQVNAWKKHLNHGVKPIGESKQIALRSLMKLTTSWSDIEPTSSAVMRDGDADLRRFAYGIVAYSIVKEKWSDATEPVKFLCTQFTNEADTEIVKSHREFINLRFANKEDFREKRKTMNNQLRDCLKTR